MHLYWFLTFYSWSLKARTGSSYCRKAHVVGGFHGQEVRAGLRLLLRSRRRSSFVKEQPAFTTSEKGKTVGKTVARSEPLEIYVNFPC